MFPVPHCPNPNWHPIRVDWGDNFKKQSSGTLHICLLCGCKHMLKCAPWKKWRKQTRRGDTREQDFPMSTP